MNLAKNGQSTDRVEIWGTYSVRDHLRPRPFVTDVFLYDRLMIPRPPNPKEEADDEGLAADNRGKEYTRWRKDWDPDRQVELLDILREEDLVVELPWSTSVQKQWANLYKGDVDEDVAARIGDERSQMLRATLDEIDCTKMQSADDAPYVATAGLIATYLSGAVQNDVARKLVALTKTPGTEIQPVIAYASYVDFVTQQLLREDATENEAEAPGGYGMLGWQIDVPEDPDKEDVDMLRAAVKLASRADLREQRQVFHAQLRQLAEGGVDPGEAATKMEKLLGEYRAIVCGSELGTVVRWVAQAVPLVAPLAGLAGPAAGVAGGIAQVSLPRLVGWLLPKREPDARVLPAAMIHDLRDFHGRL